VEESHIRSADNLIVMSKRRWRKAISGQLIISRPRGRGSGGKPYQISWLSSSHVEEAVEESHIRSVGYLVATWKRQWRKAISGQLII
jgi:hypothetical protein